MWTLLYYSVAAVTATPAENASCSSLCFPTSAVLSLSTRPPPPAGWYQREQRKAALSVFLFLLVVVMLQSIKPAGFSLWCAMNPRPVFGNPNSVCASYSVEEDDIPDMDWNLFKQFKIRKGAFLGCPSLKGQSDQMWILFYGLEN
jgi:hypothetical protein